ncbi:hypothetical protein [Aeromonas hydrophila]
MSKNIKYKIYNIDAINENLTKKMGLNYKEEQKLQEKYNKYNEQHDEYYIGISQFLTCANELGFNAANMIKFYDDGRPSLNGKIMIYVWGDNYQVSIEKNNARSDALSIVVSPDEIHREMQGFDLGMDVDVGMLQMVLAAVLKSKFEG